MLECYLCSREGFTNCSVCYKTICKVHAEEVKGKTLKEVAICSSCKKKKRLKRIQLYVIIAFFVMIIAIVAGIVFTSLNIWG
ncbi:MAG TPA: hypothetical protein VMZ29_12230 [Candidatus Bathyarchaeia archaeon]|nr:hypothetical protein [Candidatus Bathyarchaeia archaeon]